MLKIESNYGKVMVEVDASKSELFADLMCAIRSTLSAVASADEEAFDQIYNEMVKLLQDPSFRDFARNAKHPSAGVTIQLAPYIAEYLQKEDEEESDE